jgi:hypothetical protein
VTVPSGGGITINGTQDGTGSGLIPNQLFFQDNGEIASHDGAHRIIFDRANNNLELREYGSIVLSPGATKGQRTSTVTISSAATTINGNSSSPGLTVDNAGNGDGIDINALGGCGVCVRNSTSGTYAAASEIGGTFYGGSSSYGVYAFGGGRRLERKRP